MGNNKSATVNMVFALFLKKAMTESQVNLLGREMWMPHPKWPPIQIWRWWKRLMMIVSGKKHPLGLIQYIRFRKIKEMPKSSLPAPQMKTLLPSVTSALLQAWIATERGSTRAPSSKVTLSGSLQEDQVDQRTSISVCKVESKVSKSPKHKQ